MVMIQLPAHVGAFCFKSNDRHSLFHCFSHDAQFLSHDNIIAFHGVVSLIILHLYQYRVKLKIAYIIIFERFIEESEQILKRCMSNTYIK